MKNKSLFIVISIPVILLISAAITAVGAFMPVWLETYEDIYDMNFGLPFGYFSQTTDLIINATYFPRYFAPQYFNERFETVFDPWLFAASFAVNTAIAAAVYIIISVLHAAYRKSHPKKPKKQKDEYIPVFRD